MPVPIDWNALKQRATEASRNAFASYSQLRVGAAIQLADSAGSGVYTGVNVENASFGLSMCAERVAIFNAVNESGHMIIEALVAVDEHGNILSPCGACRQVALEFGGPATRVFLPGGVASLQDALADPFINQEVLAQRDAHANRDKLLNAPAETQELLMAIQGELRDLTANIFNQIDREHTRSILFSCNGGYLEPVPGFYVNLENPNEKLISIRVDTGITGGAYVLNEPQYGVPCVGVRPTRKLETSEQSKVDPELKWVVAWPLHPFGAVSVDGFNEIDPNLMREIANNADLVGITARLNREIERI